MGFRPRRVGHVGLVAADAGELARFYCEVLGMQESDRMRYAEGSPFSEAVFLRCNSDHHVLSIFGLRNPPSRDETAREPTPGLHHVAFELSSFEELRDAARYVREHGLPVHGTRTGGPGCQLRLYFWDPEGNMIELFWAIDQIGWDGQSRPYPRIEPIDLESFDLAAWLEWKGPEFAANQPLGAT